MTSNNNIPPVEGEKAKVPTGGVSMDKKGGSGNAPAVGQVGGMAAAVKSKRSNSPFRSVDKVSPSPLATQEASTAAQAPTGASGAAASGAVTQEASPAAQAPTGASGAAASGAATQEASTAAQAPTGVSGAAVSGAVTQEASPAAQAPTGASGAAVSGAVTQEASPAAQSPTGVSGAAVSGAVTQEASPAAQAPTGASGAAVSGAATQEASPAASGMARSDAAAAQIASNIAAQSSAVNGTAKSAVEAVNVKSADEVSSPQATTEVEGSLTAPSQAKSSPAVAVAVSKKTEETEEAEQSKAKEKTSQRPPPSDGSRQRFAKKDEEGSMTVLSHMGELRKRLTIIVVANVIVMFAMMGFSEILMQYLFALNPGMELVQITPSELFMVYLKVALIAALILCSPITIYQTWAFIRKGLFKEERKYVMVALFFGLICFVVGVVFCYFTVLPITLDFFVRIAVADVAPMISIESYMSFVNTMLLCFGAVFEMPILAYILAKLGILKPEFMVKNRSVMIVLIFVAAALITPPDVLSQILLALPMIVLLQISTVICKAVDKKNQKRAAKAARTA